MQYFQLRRMASELRSLNIQRFVGAAGPRGQRSAGPAGPRDAGEVELSLVLAARRCGVDHYLQVGVAVVEDVAVHGDLTDVGMPDCLTVLGVPALATEDPSAGTGRFIDRFGPVSW